MRIFAPLPVLVVALAVGCATGPTSKLVEANSSFQGDDEQSLHRLASVALKDPFTAMGRAALPPTRLKSPFVRLSPKLRHSSVREPRARRLGGAKQHRIGHHTRLAELPEVGLKDPFAGERLKDPFAR